MQTSMALQEVKRRGGVSELELLKQIHGAKGSSVYALAKALDWSYGKTEQAVGRLLSKGLVQCKQHIEKGRLQKQVFETDAAELINFGSSDLDIMEHYLKETAGLKT